MMCGDPEDCSKKENRKPDRRCGKTEKVKREEIFLYERWTAGTI